MSSSNLRERSKNETPGGRPTRARDRPRIPAPRGPSGTLPIRPEPAYGEALPSYLDRLAAFWDVRLQTMLALTGIVDEDHGSIQPVAYGAALSPERLQTFSYVTRLPEESVSGMLLASYDRIAYDFASQDLWQPKVLRKAACREWVYFAGSHMCPLCLEESSGAWKLAWKLPWSFACVRHRCLLMDTCPSCERRTGIGRLDVKCAPPFTSKVPIPSTCRNALLSLPDLRRSSPGICGHPLTQVPALLLQDRTSSPILDAQRRLDRALEGKEQIVGGEEVSSMEYFHDLRSACAMILSLGTPEDLQDVTPQVREAFAQYVEYREALRDERGDLVAAGGHWRGGPHHKPYTATPQSAALMAAIVPRAITILDAPSTEDLAGSLEPFVLRLRERNKNVRREMGIFMFSERLEGAFESYQEPYLTTVGRLGLSRGKAKPVGPTLAGLIPDHIPQLLWKDTFDKLFAELFVYGILSEEYARIFCSMSLVKLVGDHTWDGSGLELGLPEGIGRNIANAGIVILNENSNTDLFKSRLYGLAEQLAQESYLTDYGFRRRVLADLDDIDSTEWSRICKSAGIRRGRLGRRSGAASAWLWCQLTEGHRRLAPWFLKNGDDASYMVYCRFLDEALDKLETGLLAYGDSLLKGCSYRG